MEAAREKRIRWIFELDNCTPGYLDGRKRTEIGDKSEK